MCVLAIITIFRNIIERSYGGLVLKRKDSEGIEHGSLLRDFQSAKESSWSIERRERQHLVQQGNANSVVVGLCVIIIVLLLLLVSEHVTLL